LAGTGDAQMAGDMKLRQMEVGALAGTWRAANLFAAQARKTGRQPPMPVLPTVPQRGPGGASSCFCLRTIRGTRAH